MRSFFSLLILLLASLVCVAQQGPSTAASAGASTEDLQKATQNPVANLISVPFQDNINFNAGPYARDQNILNIQPVIPVKVSADWNLIIRWIAPITYQPDYAQPNGGTFGLGDMQPTFFFAPSKVTKIIWGVGPAFLIPTATADSLGTGKFGLGPSVVGLVQPGHWTIGALASNIWSVAGSGSRPSVNSFTLQYFLNYNLREGWFLTSAPILTSNWNAPSGDQWTVPFGGGAGRIFKIGKQPVNGSVTAYYNVVRPQPVSPTWQLRLQLALLFPKMPKPPSK